MLTEQQDAVTEQGDTDGAASLPKKVVSSLAQAHRGLTLTVELFKAAGQPGLAERAGAIRATLEKITREAGASGGEGPQQGGMLPMNAGAGAVRPVL